MSHAPQSSEQDQVVLMDDIPHPDHDTSAPFVLANERLVAIVYRIAKTDFERFGPFSDDDPFCVIAFMSAAFHQFGPPRDADLPAYFLASKGLLGYSAHEVMRSSLVADSWGPAYSLEGGLRHFVLTFGDSTFECVAGDCTVAGIYGNGDIAAREAFSLCQ
ncbi:hypothetical protein [Paraburkholderia gardini]|uniref:Uncharacterized protein n=1 Tax=Paraburkholderia gardini TaxID=2823469 RepID=A0ABN7QRS5_9BURK|nr:hypothetical protein [Paraburkholderia gardini]CAG4914388.1 hypothetical protein R54767_04095 [Paraburkholderia gardini]